MERNVYIVTQDRGHFDFVDSKLGTYRHPVYVSSVDKLFGLRNVTIIVHAKAALRRDYDKIMDRVREIATTDPTSHVFRVSDITR